MCDEHPLSHLLPQTIVISRLLFFLHRHYHCHCRFFGQPCCRSLVPLLTCTMFFTFIFSLYLSNVQCSFSVSDSDSERVNHINHSRNVDAHYAKTEYIEWFTEWIIWWDIRWKWVFGSNTGSVTLPLTHSLTLSHFTSLAFILSATTLDSHSMHYKGENSEYPTIVVSIAVKLS